MFICGNCASRIKTKEPGAGASWCISICSYCNKKSYVCDTRDYGISTTSQVEDGDSDVENLMNLL
jgi:hypothetical protein